MYFVKPFEIDQTIHLVACMVRLIIASIPASDYYISYVIYKQTNCVIKSTDTSHLSSSRAVDEYKLHVILMRKSQRYHHYMADINHVMYMSREKTYGFCQLTSTEEMLQ